MRSALLLARVSERDPAAMTARSALELATRGGAKVLGRDDIGHLAPACRPISSRFDIDQPQFAGSHWDPVAALVLCQTGDVDYSFINGRPVVHQRRLLTSDLETLGRKARACSHVLMACNQS